MQQHPDQPQSSATVSSLTRNLFRAQGPPITLEIPLRDCSALVPIGSNSMQVLDSDYEIRRIAGNLVLLSNFGPQPSFVMLLSQLSEMAHEARLMLLMKGPHLEHSWNFRPIQGSDSWWTLVSDAPWWGNINEASSSRAQVMSVLGSTVRPLVIAQESQDVELQKGKELVVYDADFAVHQILHNMHPFVDSTGLDVEMWDGYDHHDGFGMQLPVGDDSGSLPTSQDGVLEATPISIKKRRVTKAKTPIVDDEVRRSNRLKAGVTVQHIQLDNEPRRRKAKKEDCSLLNCSRPEEMHSAWKST